MNPNLNQEDIRLFEILRAARKRQSQVLKERAVRGVKRGIVEKYAESGHFVYELLQNADDAEATYVDIILSRDSLVLKHNGRIQFTLTDEDDENTPPGHLNSITAIGLSDKQNSTNKIGKFGVGFKSVLQYTDIPYIYDDKFWFKIEDMLFPTLLDKDHPMRKKGETLFFFEFKEPEKSYREIKERLYNLDNPVLFLHHLKSISVREVENLDIQYRYSKEVIEDFSGLSQLNDITCQLIVSNNGTYTTRMCLFGEEVSLKDKGVHTINVAYLLNAEGKIDISARPVVYCFFRTEEVLENQKFICHAPFILTDSRQTIKKDEEINNTLKKRIARLAASALPILRDYGKKRDQLLIDDSLFDIIPYEKNRQYIHQYNELKLVEDIFYDAFRNVMRNEALILSRNNHYLTPSQTYTAVPVDLINYLNQTQLTQLTNRSNVDFVSRELSVRVNSPSNYRLRDYCEGLGCKVFKSEDLARALTNEFMQQQPKDWYLRLGHFLIHFAEKLWKTDIINHRTTEALPFRRSPIIRSTTGKWIAPYTENGELNVFFPIDESEVTEYNVVSQELIDNKMYRQFMEDLGIKEPDKGDYIDKKILCYYRDDYMHRSAQQMDADLEVMFSYYKSLTSGDASRFIEKLRECMKVRIGTKIYSVNHVYADSQKNKRMLQYNSSCSVMSYAAYPSTLQRFSREDLEMFFIELGMRKDLQIKQIIRDDLGMLSKWMKKQILREHCSCDYLKDYVLEDSKELFEHVESWDSNLVRDIWDLLTNTHNIEKYFESEYHWKYYSWYSKVCASSFAEKIKTIPWLFGKLPSDYTAEELESQGLEGNKSLYAMLGISSSRPENVSDEAWKDQQMGTLVRELGLTEDDLRSIAQQKNKKCKSHFSDENDSSDKDNTLDGNGSKNLAVKHKGKKEETKSMLDNHEDYSDTWEKEFGELKNQKNQKPKAAGASSFAKHQENESEEEVHSVFGTAEFSLRGNSQDKDAKSNREAEKKFTEAQNGLIEALNVQELRAKLDVTPQYTYKWFSLLLGLKKLKQPKENKMKSLDIVFFDYELSEDEGMLTLKRPTSQIPGWVEESTSINLGAFSPKETSIDAKIVCVDAEEGQMYFDVRDQKQVKAILSRVKKFVVVCQSPSNVFDSLMRRFAQLDYPMEQNMKETLTENISFIYGPPGTGKTTEVIKQMANLVRVSEKAEKSCNILVLTPTNKAADVIVDKILIDRENKDLDIEIRQACDKCYDYICRYGITNSKAYIEEFGCVANRDTFSIEDSPRNIVVTTIARFAYDYMQPNNHDICDFGWDYIVFDEASMIDLIPLMYTLHKAKDSYFIIAGDPKQIPSVNTTGYDYGNIYTCMGINQLEYAMKYFKQYPLTALTTQYRSIPDIGNLVSVFCYDGLVKGVRKNSESKRIRIDGFDFAHINFLGFDIKDFNILYSRNTIGQSSINIYSVIFTYEFVKYMISQLSKHNANETYSIGVVSPYRAEADAIRQMFENYPVSINVSCGTVHSFQGDQCDIIVFVMNPAIGNSTETNVNREYILNVAMSRAKDYLFIIAPAGDDVALPILSHVKNILCEESIRYTEESCSFAELQIFNDSHWIENHTSITGHGSINTYNEMQNIYDIRISDTALDIRKQK